MNGSKNKYPIGQQDFRTLRERRLLYIDKTDYIKKIVENGAQYFFLARPRRFGKSLFLSTLRYFFEGRRELFTGLRIDTPDRQWESFPVLYLDLNQNRYAETGILDDVLDNTFRKWEKLYGVDIIAEQPASRLANIIEAAHIRTGRQVVILIDEYGKPLVGNLHKEDIFEHYRARLAAIYSNFKSSAEHIRLVFLTGVSRFSKLSVFSDLNNLMDITFSDEFADVCGITERELLDCFQSGIQTLAEEYQISRDEACHRLKLSYDGYRFAKKGSDIYNPWSVLNAMYESRIGTYWNATGSASIIAAVLHNADVDIENTLNSRWSLARLAGLDLRNADPTAMLYQTGYLTIASYNPRNDTVSLKIPNNEVKEGLFNDLLPYYVKVRRRSAESLVNELIDNIDCGQPEKMMKNLDAYFASIPYELKMDNENNFHNAFYILLTLIGVNAKAEVHTSDGSIDLLIGTHDYVYIIELKYDSSPEIALRQIDEKQYARGFATDARRLFKIGVSFSSAGRRIEGWKIVG